MEEAVATQPSPDIPAQPQPQRKRFLLRWSLLATVLVAAYFMWQCGSGMRAGGQLSDEAVRHFHSQMDSEAYEQILDESDDAFRNSETRDELIKFLTGIHSKLGASGTFTRTNVLVNVTTSGTFIKVSYQSVFEKGKAAEAFPWRKSGDGLKLVRYDVNSNAFLTDDEVFPGCDPLDIPRLTPRIASCISFVAQSAEGGRIVLSAAHLRLG